MKSRSKRYFYKKNTQRYALRFMKRFRHGENQIKSRDWEVFIKRLNTNPVFPTFTYDALPFFNIHELNDEPRIFK